MRILLVLLLGIIWSFSSDDFWRELNDPYMDFKEIETK